MARVHTLPGIDAAEREASEWITRLNADHVSDEDRARFEAWRSASPRHARAYEEMAASYARFVAAGPLVRAVSFGNSMQEATHVRRFPWRLTLAAVASVIGVALLLTWWYRSPLVPDTRFQTAIGEHATVSLPDGSSLELNSNSLALVDYSTEARIIRLERGEAYFEVKHDTARPFWVVAGRSWVRAVGTAFNVYVRPSDVQVTVSEGTVKVATAREHDAPSDRALQEIATSVVTAGEQVQVRGTDAHLRSLAPTELTRSVAWRSGTLNFEHQPLDQVVDELSRYTTVKVVIDDSSLRQLPVGGTFDANAQGMEALLVMLEDGFGFEVKRDGADRATIERRAAAPDAK